MKDRDVSIDRGKHVIYTKKAKRQPARDVDRPRITLDLM